MRSVIRRTRFCLFTIVGLLSAVIGAANADNTSRAKGEKTMSIELTAIVVEYVPNAMHDNFEDGSFAVYDGTVLRIVSPQKYRGKLVVYHDKPASDKSPWRALGATIQFSLDREVLESKSTQIFVGTVDVVKLKAREDRRKPNTGAAKGSEVPKKPAEADRELADANALDVPPINPRSMPAISRHRRALPSVERVDRRVNPAKRPHAEG